MKLKYNFMERTDKFVAKLDKFDTNAFPDRYYDIEEMIYAYKKTKRN